MDRSARGACALRKNLAIPAVFPGKSHEWFFQGRRTMEAKFGIAKAAFALLEIQVLITPVAFAIHGYLATTFADAYVARHRVYGCYLR